MNAQEIRKLANDPHDSSAWLAREVLLACADVTERCQQYLDAAATERTTYNMRQALARLEAIKP